MAAYYLPNRVMMLLLGGGVVWWVWGLILLFLAGVVLWLTTRKAGKKSPDAVQPLDRASEEKNDSMDIEPESAEFDGEATHMHLGDIPVDIPAGETNSTGLEPEMDEPEADEDILPAIFAGGTDRNDLKLIRGITPPIVSVLNAAGIHSFSQLAETSPEQLEKILRSAGMRISNSASWPGQARLAEAGDWEGLEGLQQPGNS